METFGSTSVEYLTETELKEKYKNSLQNKYNVQRSKNKRFSIKRFGRFAALFLFVICSIFITRNLLENEGLALAEQLLIETKMIGNPDAMRKGVTDINLTRSNANRAFIRSEYPATIRYLEQIQNKSYLDKLYLGISYTHTKKYSRAIEMLRDCKSSYLSQEASWYLGLALVLSKDSDAKTVLQGIINGKTYQYKNAQLLLEKL